jgi:predicted transcriptional regulator
MFKTEKQLSESIKQELLRNPNMLIRSKLIGDLYFTQEVSGGHGIADIVVSWHKRVTKRNQILSLFDINILQLIQKEQELSFKQIISQVNSSPYKVKKTIQKLVLEKMVLWEDDCVRVYRGYENYQKETVAIEVKLKNWRRALEQAYRYRSFAYYSYVFLDERFVDSAIKNKKLFLQYNIGLASVSKNKGINILFKPAKGNPFDSKMNMLFNESIVDHFLSARKVSQVSK